MLNLLDIIERELKRKRKLESVITELETGKSELAKK